MQKNLTKKIALCGILSTLGVLTFTIENLFPPIILPGARMGISNIFILLATIILGIKYGVATLVVKTVLGSLFSGNLSAIIYSLPAGLIALIVEIVLIYAIKNVSIPAISIAGAVINSTLQNLTFCLITNASEYLFYLPYLALISVVSGLIVGIAVLLIVKNYYKAAKDKIKE